MLFLYMIKEKPNSKYCQVPCIKLDIKKVSINIIRKESIKRQLQRPDCLTAKLE